MTPGRAPDASDVVRTTCPRDCYDACGALVMRRAGRIHSVRGDPDHPVSRGRLCRKCATGYNGAFLDPDLRITTPLVRTGPKGSGSFAPASWDEALALVAGRLGEVAANPGPEAILNAHYTGTFAVLGYGFGQRFLNRLGATEVDPDTVCNLAGHVALDLVYGASEAGFDPRTIRDAACVLVWGANPSASAPHQDEHWLAAARDVVVVDPIATPTARAAGLHLQPFPGSDAALAFAIGHVIVRDGLADRSFLAKHAVGFEELERALEPCIPAWAQDATGVDAALVEEAARRYSARPSLLWIGQGMQRQPMGGNAVRAVASLPALTGNVGRRGAGFLYLNGHAIRGIDDDYVTGAHLAPAPRPAISQMDLAERLEDRDRSRALVCWNMLEHQHRSLQPAAGAAARRARARGHLHRRDRPLRDGHGGLRRRRASRGELPRVRRRRRAVLRPGRERAGQGG